MTLGLWPLILVPAGNVSGEEASPVMAGLDVEAIEEFDSLDRDRSRGLEEKEFESSEIALRARDGGNRVDITRVFIQMDRNGDGSIDLLELIASQHNRNTRILGRESARKYFAMDSNGDGLISFDEYLNRPKAKAEIFERIDLNASGTVGPFEWAQGIRDEFMSADLAGVFAGLDQDDSGFVDSLEFSSLDSDHVLAGAFSQVDLNGNSQVGPGEFAKALSSGGAEAEGISEEILTTFRELDRNQDQVLSRREFLRSDFGVRGSPKKLPDIMFSKADWNNDDELSLKEFSQIRRRPDGMGPKGKGGPGKGKGGSSKGKGKVGR